jgi:hypothetical protein
MEELMQSGEEDSPLGEGEKIAGHSTLTNLPLNFDGLCLAGRSRMGRWRRRCHGNVHGGNKGNRRNHSDLQLRSVSVS